jgi:Flp pilus assembly protein TadD
LEKLTKANIPAFVPYIDFTKARIVWQKQEWSEAARLLKAVQPKLIDLPLEQSMAGAMLAASYERQGKNDLALKTYEDVLEKNPNYEGAKLGLQALRERMGINTDSQAGDLDKAIDEMAKMPAAQQDWAKIDQLVQQIAEERDFTEARIKLVQANVMLKREKFEEAKELIREAALLEPDNINISFAAVALLAAEPGAGPSKALELLAKVEKKAGDNLRVRATRAQLLRAANPENIAEQLVALTEGIDGWTPQEQAELLATISAQFEQLRQYDKAREYLLQTVKLLPDSLPVRVRLFDIAYQEHNSEQMLAAEKLILDLVKDEKDGNYIHSKVRRMMWEYTQQKVLREELAETRKLLDGVLKQRPEWAELHILYGQLLLVLEEDQELALQHLEDALKYGPPNANALALQVKLLGQRGLMTEARQKLEMIPETFRQQLLGRSEAEVLILTGDKTAALAAAKKVAEAEPDNVTTQVWFSRIANQAGDYAAAEAALIKATELQPTDSEIWMQLLALHASHKNSEGIEETLRAAQLAVEGDFLPLLTAKKYELLGDWQAAEKLYLASFANRLDELPIAQRMAEFYFLWAQAGKVPVSKASPYVNRILRQANEGTIEQDNPYVLWAREQGAKLLAGTGDYQQSLKAQRLLGSEGDVQKLPQQQKALLAHILASRNEPQAQLKAIEMLSKMDKDGTITKEGVLALAQLLSKAGDWNRSQDLMFNAIEKFRSDEQVRATFINMLIARDDYLAANKQLEDLKKLNPKSTAYTSLSIKAAAESGNQTKLKSLLKAMLPPNLTGALDQQQLENVLTVARLATEHGESELAAQLYPLYIQRTGLGALEYARFLALHDDPAKALEIMKQLFPKQMDDVLQVCAEMLRKRRAEFGDKYDAAVDEFMAAALRDDPDSVQRMLIQAELLETQARYEESITKYDNVLKRDDVPRMMRAAAMNNLGFLLTLLNQRTEEAEELINQALEVYGPVDDILDTRAIVRMARKDYDAAVEDMSLATSLSTDPIKFYHFAQANLLAGNDQAALKAWEQAQKLGFKKENLPVLEQPHFEQVKGEIEGLRTQNAKL